MNKSHNERLLLILQYHVLNERKRKGVENDIIGHAHLFLIQHVKKTKIKYVLQFGETLLNEHWRYNLIHKEFVQNVADLSC